MQSKFAAHQLAMLFESLYTDSELRRFLRNRWGPDVVHSLPGAPVDLKQLCHEASLLAQRRDLTTVDGQLFQHLVRDRGGRRRDIEGVAKAFGIELGAVSTQGLALGSRVDYAALVAGVSAAHPRVDVDGALSRLFPPDRSPPDFQVLTGTADGGWLLQVVGQPACHILRVCPVDEARRELRTWGLHKKRRNWSGPQAAGPLAVASVVTQDTLGLVLYGPLATPQVIQPLRSALAELLSGAGDPAPVIEGWLDALDTGFWELAAVGPPPLASSPLVGVHGRLLPPVLSATLAQDTVAPERRLDRSDLLDMASLVDLQVGALVELRGFQVGEPDDDRTALWDGVHGLQVQVTGGTGASPPASGVVVRIEESLWSDLERVGSGAPRRPALQELLGRYTSAVARAGVRTLSFGASDASLWLVVDGRPRRAGFHGVAPAEPLSGDLTWLEAELVQLLEPDELASEGLRDVLVEQVEQHLQRERGQASPGLTPADRLRRAVVSLRSWAGRRGLGPPADLARAWRHGVATHSLRRAADRSIALEHRVACLQLAAAQIAVEPDRARRPHLQRPRRTASHEDRLIQNAESRLESARLQARYHPTSSGAYAVLWEALDAVIAPALLSTVGRSTVVYAADLLHPSYTVAFIVDIGLHRNAGTDGDGLRRWHAAVAPVAATALKKLDRWLGEQDEPVGYAGWSTARRKRLRRLIDDTAPGQALPHLRSALET